VVSWLYSSTNSTHHWWER